MVSIYWLSDWSPRFVRRPLPAPPVRLAGLTAQEELAIYNPTLFALPSVHGFSGKAWLTPPVVQFESSPWSEPTDWLGVTPAELGSTFTRLAEIGSYQSLPLPGAPKPEPDVPRTEPSRAWPGKSIMILEGFEDWRLDPAPELPSWHYNDILTNTVVSVLVNNEGQVFSAAIVSTNGYKPADTYALQQARTAKFRRIKGSQQAASSNPDGPLTWGNIIFEWHTLPPTNAPAAAEP
jgi:hypothetical protein